MDPEPTPPAAPRRKGRRRRRRRQRILAVALGVLTALGLFLLTVDYLDHGPTASSSGALSVQLSPTPTKGYAPLTVTLVAAVSGGVPPYVVTWTSGGTPIGSGSTSLVAFNAAGNQTVTARAVDSVGTSASSTTVIEVVSPFPEAQVFVPAQTSDHTDLLAIDWHASAPVSSCILASWGTIDVPTFAGCGAAGGEAHGAATNESVVFQVDPDDPEVTPILFQSTDAGVQVSVGWWLNNTSPVAKEQGGVISVTTAVQSL